MSGKNKPGHMVFAGFSCNSLGKQSGFVNLSPQLKTPSIQIEIDESNNLIRLTTGYCDATVSELYGERILSHARTILGQNNYKPLVLPSRDEVHIWVCDSSVNLQTKRGLMLGVQVVISTSPSSTYTEKMLQTLCLRINSEFY